MAIPPHIKVLFFDVFGTCVQQRTPVAEELHKACQEALKSNTNLSEDMRRKAGEMVTIARPLDGCAVLICPLHVRRMVLIRRRMERPHRHLHQIPHHRARKRRLDRRRHPSHKPPTFHARVPRVDPAQQRHWIPLHPNSTPTSRQSLAPPPALAEHQSRNGAAESEV